MADAVGFETFVRAHSDGLYRTAFLLVGSRPAAEDLLQDTLSNLYPQWSRVAAADVPLAYVRRSLVNRFVSQRRAGSGRDVAMWELPDRWDGRDMAETVALRGTLWQLLHAIPERQRAAIVLRHFHDLPEPEIAAVLGCRPVTVRSLISRGLATMRSTLLATESTAQMGMKR